MNNVNEVIIDSLTVNQCWNRCKGSLVVDMHKLHYLLNVINFQASLTAKLH